MITMRLSTVKPLFFDSARVTRAMDKATRQALSKAGAFIRRTARRSMPRRKGPSQPGRPPHAHGRAQLRKFIYFACGPAGRSVIIGPVGLGRARVPELMEQEHVRGGSRRVAGRAPGGRRKIYRYTARPFMGPALRQELPDLPRRWHNSLE